MRGKVIVVKRKSVTRAALLCGAILFLVLTAFRTDYVKSVAASVTAGWRTEPETAQDMDDPPFSQLPAPYPLLPVSEVMAEGKEIELSFAYNDPDWRRQAYKSYWHNGRWSYVPVRIHYAMHRLFVTYPTASVYYDFIHNLGIAAESEHFELPESSHPFANIVVVVMQARAEKIVTLGNQVLIIGAPALTGLQVLSIPVRDLEPSNAEESILFQLVTDQGSEYDNATLAYVAAPPSPGGLG